MYYYVLAEAKAWWSRFIAERQGSSISFTADYFWGADKKGSKLINASVSTDSELLKNLRKSALWTEHGGVQNVLDAVNFEADEEGAPASCIKGKYLMGSIVSGVFV